MEKITKYDRKKLTPFEISLIEDYHLSDRTREEVAEELDVPPCSIPYRLDKIKEKLGT